MSISSVGSQISSLQAITAQQAFQKNIKKKEEIQENNFQPEPLPKTLVQDIPKHLQENIQEIKKFASNNNITDVDDDDIHYSLKYGTSVFADYTA